MKRLLLLALPLALAACTRPADPSTAPRDAAPALAAPVASATADASLLPKYHWRLHDATDAHGQRIAALFARPDQPVQLDFRDGRVGVSNTCNRMGGTYTLADGSLKLRVGASYPLAEAARAHADLEGRRTTGSIVLIP